VFDGVERTLKWGVAIVLQLETWTEVQLNRFRNELLIMMIISENMRKFHWLLFHMVEDMR